MVEGGGRILGVAVKLARSVADRDVRHLHWLAANSGQPTSLMVLTTGEEAFTRADGVAVVPLALLGP